MSDLPVDSSSQQQNHHRNIRIVLLGLAAFLYWFCLYVYVPTLPVYVQSKVISLAMVGTVLSMYGFWQFISRLPTGISADRLGRRKPFIIAGLIIVGGGALVMGNASGTNGLIIGRALTGIGAATWVPLLVLYTMLFPPEQIVRATAILTFIQTLGRIVSSLSTGFLNQMGGYNLAFQISALSAGIAVILLLVYPERKRVSTPPSITSLARIFLKPEVLTPTFLSIILHYADFSSTVSFIPLLARGFGASDIYLSGLSSANLLFALLGNVIISSLGSRISTKKALIIGFVVLITGLSGAALAPSLMFLSGAQLLIGLAYGLTYPVLISESIRHVAENERNTAMGLHQSGYALGMFAGPWLGGILATALGIQPMLGATAAILVILIVLGITRLKKPA